MPDPILIVCGDLFFGSQLHSQGKQAGYATKTALSCAQAIKLLAAEPFSWVVLDLELSPLDLEGLRQSSAAHPGCQLVAFGPHVHTNLFEQAKLAGCDLVLTRGQASQALQEIFASK